MEDKLRLNTALYGGFEGVIGRRDFALNSVYIWSIALIFSLPYTIWMMTNCETLLELFDTRSVFCASPILLKLWVLIGFVCISVLSVSNIIRRLNDINGDEKKAINIVISAVSVFVGFSSYIFPLQIVFLFTTIGFVIWIYLVAKEGNITSKSPYDVTKIFNWGAFLGTWIWGLFNKSYIPLWYILLHYTPWGFYFTLICGLKGNEWAYKNKKWDDVDAFNKSQERQTTFWAIFVGIVSPILIFLLIFGLTAAFIWFGADYSQKHPETAQKQINSIEKTLKDYSLSYFESYEITSSENKFYVLEKDWKSYDFTDKKDILEIAASISANDRREKDSALNKTPKGTCSYSHYSKSSELPKTKIYGKKTGKLLGEFVIDESVMENASAIDIIKAAMKAYRFYKP